WSRASTFGSGRWTTSRLNRRTRHEPRRVVSSRGSPRRGPPGSHASFRWASRPEGRSTHPTRDSLEEKGIVTSSQRKKPHGQVRQSQLVTTFGPGALFDLPDHSVIVGGLEYWTKGDQIIERRLESKLMDLLQVPSLALHAPPPENDDPTSNQKTGITSWQFPGWFITQGALSTEPARSTRSRRLIHRSLNSSKLPV